MKISMNGAMLAVILLAVWIYASPAMAQSEEAGFVPEDRIKQEDDKEADKDGWHFRFKPSANINLSDSRKVVGQADGTSFTLGVSLDLRIEFFKGKHEWRNTFLLTEAISRTPALDAFIISADSLKIESMYLYYFLDWVGLYGRFALDTSMFPGYDVRAEPTLYATYNLDGTVNYLLDDKIKLTEPFAPLTLKQGLGPFFRPVNQEEVNLEIMLGLGAWETFADDNYAINDDDLTPEVELKTLQDTFQIGPENLYKLWGEVLDKKIAYLVSAELMMPFYTDPDIGIEGIDMLNVELGARLDFRFVEWMSLAYEFKALKQSQIVDEWQIQNNILLTFSYGLYEHIRG